MTVRKLILLGVFFSTLYINGFSQTFTKYPKEWRRVDSLIDIAGLPKTALSEVRKIYARAKKEWQEAEQIKALIYITRLQVLTRDQYLPQVIKQMEIDIGKSTELAAAILNSLQAELYWNYFQAHRYILYNRTNTENFNQEDISTWSAAELQKKIASLYLRSLDKELLLRKNNLTGLAPIIIKGNSTQLRPTLYDLLAHRALDYFKNNESEVTRPVYAFEIIQPEAFAAALVFKAYNFSSVDSFSNPYKALKIYQRLIGFHLKDKNASALADVDIERIEFVHNSAVMENKEQLYEQALKAAIDQYQPQGGATQAGYLLALYYKNLSQEGLPDTTHRLERAKAHHILKRIVADSAVKNQGWTNSYNLLKEINKPSFSFEIEKVNLPAQPFRALIKYQNIAALSFRILQVRNLPSNFLSINDEKSWQRLKASPYLKTWRQSVPATNDYLEHSVEIKIDSLPLGTYILLASADTSFEAKNNLLGAGLFHISNISYVNKENKIFVLDRAEGQPLENSKVTVYQRNYNQAFLPPKTRLGEYLTDKNGWVELPKRNQPMGNYFFEIQYDADTLSLEQPLYYFYSNSFTRGDENKIFFYTDRSIYRPDQMVFFKGIAIKKDSLLNTISTNYPATIYLRNVNFDIVDSLEVTTNDFGSFSGKFHIPQTGLNGVYTITDKYNSNTTEIRVEEYKRPTFDISFDSISTTYKLEDSIRLTGLVKSYAGNLMDGVRVNYHIMRRSNFIYRWERYPTISPTEIAHGNTITDKEGKFSIWFKAHADKKINKNLSPFFDFQVIADVTNGNGETRSEEEYFKAGYQSILIQVKIPEKMAVDSLRTLNIRTENTMGRFVAAQLTLTVRPLIGENRLIRKRLWKAPDQFILSREAFILYFPHDEYKEETDYTKWPEGDIISTQTDSTKEDGAWQWKGLPLKPGFYCLTMRTKDKEGKEIKVVSYIELFNNKINRLESPQYLWTYQGNPTIEPGQAFAITIGTSANIFLIQEVNKQKDTSSHFYFTKLNKEKTNFSFAVTEKDRGGYGVNFFFVKDNRLYQYHRTINVPWSNKDLHIQYVSFRDKTLPGSKETWKIKITGRHQQKVIAESLVSMYDASLDQFSAREWSRPELWPIYQSFPAWNGGQNFNTVPSNLSYLFDPLRYFTTIYDRLLPALTNQNNYFFNRLSRSALRISVPGPFEQDKPSNGALVFSNKDSATSLYQTKWKPAGVTSSFQTRKNFEETAFFFPGLKTDGQGITEFTFSVPDALTKWKLQIISHTKDLAFGTSQNEMVVQKPLMVQTNMPRFLRQGDHVELTATLVNLSDTEITGQVQLELKDGSGLRSVDGWFLNSFPHQYFTVPARRSVVVQFPLQVPNEFNSTLLWRIVAKTAMLSDGEENILPVLTDKILVTETLPLSMIGNGHKKVDFKNLLTSASSETLQNHALAVEYTSNPSWYILQSLPYFMQESYQCTEQTWNRYFANSLGSYIVHSSARIQKVWDQWKQNDTEALVSPLEKNQQYKTTLLEETPWVLDARNEQEQKKNISRLFDSNQIKRELAGDLEKLNAMQFADGSFPWFKGGPPDLFITQYIMTGMAHLKKATGSNPSADLRDMANKAITWIDTKMVELYKKQTTGKTTKHTLSSYAVQYIYMRSYFKDYPLAEAARAAHAFFTAQAVQNWVRQSISLKAMIALALFRNGNSKVALAILKSIKETALYNEELGTYFKEAEAGWFWWQAPVESQSVVLEAFNEISQDLPMVNGLRTWLIKNRQTTHWQSTKATAEACYAFLFTGTSWLDKEPLVAG
ncbi:MAG: alpha-2-macroglobulin family protein [Flavisolibacter sp.]